MNNPVYFKSPYLRYDVAADLNKIKAIKKRIALQFSLKNKTVVSSLSASTAITALVDQPLDGDSDLGNTGLGSLGDARHKDFATSKAAGLRFPQPAVASPKDIASVGISTSKISAVQTNMVTVTPSGAVPMGFNCARKFHAKALSGTHGAQGYFKIQFSQTGSSAWGSAWLDSYFVGVEEVDASMESFIEFDIGPVEYASYAQNGYSYFRITWSEPTNSGWLEWQSDPVNLVWSAPPCNQINSVWFTIGGNVVDPCSLEGSKNGSEPAFYVGLTLPAQPGGQIVRIRSNNTNLGWIMNAPHYDLVIPAGQHSGGVSWFLGTKNVAKDKSFDLIARLVFPDGSESTALAYGTVNLT